MSEDAQLIFVIAATLSFTFSLGAMICTAYAYKHNKRRIARMRRPIGHITHISCGPEGCHFEGVITDPRMAEIFEPGEPVFKNVMGMP